MQAAHYSASLRHTAQFSNTNSQMPQEMLSDTAPSSRSGNAAVVGRNFVYMGLEVLITLVVTLLTSIIIARTIGPTRLGYFNLILWLTSIACSVGSLGIPLTTFKYLAEFLGSGQRELARATFFYNLRAQTAIASVLTALGMIAAIILADPAYRLTSILLVLSILPNMVTFVPSQANTAAETSIHNTRGALIRAVIYVAGVAVSLILGWNLVGIAAGILVSCIAELVAKLIPVLKSMSAVRQVPLPEDIRKRMFSFSGIATGLMILQIVVWDRSDIIFLKLLQPDIRQLAYFSVCFSIVDRLTLPGQALANALSATQMAEYGRDQKNLFNMTSQAFVYVFMGTLPILVGIACVGGPFIRAVYGPLYLPAIPVFILVALLSIPKALLTPARAVLYAAEELGFILKWGCVAGVINIALDVLLIPGHGAIGAAVGNGVAQTFAAVTLAWSVLARYPVRINTSTMLRLGAATLAMAIVVVGVVMMPLSAPVKLIGAIPLGAAVFAIMARVFMMLQKQDRQRLLTFSTFIPSSARPCYEMLVNFVVPAPPMAEVSR